MTRECRFASPLRRQEAQMATQSDASIVRRAEPRLTWDQLGPEVTNALLEEIAGKIARAFNPHKVVLFGSYAHGQPTLDSDVDLLVIMESHARPVARARTVRAVAGVDFLPMDVLVRTPRAVPTAYPRCRAATEAVRADRQAPLAAPASRRDDQPVQFRVSLSWRLRHGTGGERGDRDRSSYARGAA